MAIGTGPAAGSSSSHPVGSILTSSHSILIGIILTRQAPETGAKQKRRSKKPAQQPVCPSIQRAEGIEPLCALPKSIQQKVGSANIIIFLAIFED